MPIVPFRRLAAAASLSACVVMGLALPAAAADSQALAAEAKQVMASFADALKGELTAAMQQGGPVKAIEVCNTRAVPLAEKAAADSGWSVGRSSHGLRNPGNAPDTFTAQAIAEFLARERAGEKAADLVKAAVTDDNGAQVFHFVKAIPTAEMCLTCHGSDIKPEVAAALDGLYPGDAARGFSAGQMRGVFTLAKKL